MQENENTESVEQPKFGFKRCITPKIVSVMYPLSVALLVAGLAGGIVLCVTLPQLSLLHRICGGIVVFGLCAALMLAIRVGLELIMLLFRIKENTEPHEFDLELNPDAQPFFPVDIQEAGQAGAVSQSTVDRVTPQTAPGVG